MKFELNIKNIGKLEDAKIRIGRFTVLAGPNNTGKSYVSKLLYSLFDALSVNPVAVHFENLTKPLLVALIFLKMNTDGMGHLLDPLQKEVEELHKQIIKHPASDFENLNKTVPSLAKRVAGMRKNFLSNKSLIQSLQKDRYDEVKTFAFSSGSERVEYLEQLLKKLEEDISGMDAEEFALAGIQYKVRENIIHNFQVPRISDLSRNENEPSVVDVGEFGKFTFSDAEIGFDINYAWFRDLQKYSNVIYLESPLYWKLKKALENARSFSSLGIQERDKLGGVPGYFYDLARKMSAEYIESTTPNTDLNTVLSNLSEKLTGKDVLGGKIVISSSGDLSFQENERSFSLPLTAMGVTNLGILALLIERKVVDTDSFIFIDEPEAHLHPAWQVIIAETLFKLAKAGVYVVIATHSAEILKWLEVHVKNHPEDEKLISLNKFPVGKENDDQDFDVQIANIKQELTKPFADLYMSGL